MEMSEAIARRTRLAMRRPWWKSPDPLLLHLQEEDNADQTRRLMRWGLAIGGLSCVGFIFADILLLPDVAFALALVRILTLAGGMAAIEYGIRKKLRLVVLQLFSAASLLAAALGFLLVASQTDYTEVLFSYSIFASIFVLGVNLFFNFRFPLSVATSGLITAAYVIAFLSYMDAEFSGKVINASFFVMIFSLSLYLSWRLGLERYHTFVNGLQAQIQEKVALEKGEQLKKIADTDPLTGLKNRRALGREFLVLSRRSVDLEQRVAVLLIDVDYFKKFNDSLGHNAGDECLTTIANCFSKTAQRFGGVAGRFGGEEFLILCPVKDREQLGEISAAICQAVEDLNIPHPDRPDSKDVVTVSVGATMTENGGVMDLVPLMQQADRALYASKFASRATYTVYDPDAIDDPSRKNLNELLKVAIERDLVSLVYQPIFDAKTGRLQGQEALMRLRDFDDNPVHPPVFIPVAEQSGAIIELGVWALERACTDLLQNPLGDFVSVNVSAVQLKSDGFPLQVAEVLTRLGLAPRRLALEVTEGIDIVMEVQAQRNIEQLRRLGVRIWLDDFGTGFAGLAWLNRFRFDVVKIDRSFLIDCQSEQGLSLLQDMVRMLRNQEFKVLVEGVETADQRALLKRLGVDHMQGYFLGKPRPISVVREEAAKII